MYFRPATRQKEAVEEFMINCVHIQGGKSSKPCDIAFKFDHRSLTTDGHKTAPNGYESKGMLRLSMTKRPLKPRLFGSKTN